MDTSRKPTITVKNSQETDRTFTELSNPNFVQPDTNKFLEDSEDEFELSDDSTRLDGDADDVEDEHTVKLTVTILAAFPSGKQSSTNWSLWPKQP